MVYICLQRCLKLLIILIITVGGTGIYGILPEASQEGMLHPFKSYSDVTLFHYNVPTEVSRATWEFAAFMDNPTCPIKDVHIYIQHGSYPVISPDNSSFPRDVITRRTSLHYIATRSAYQPHDATILPLYNPLPGNWFAVAYIAHWDQQVQQEGLGHKCHYSLGSVAVWNQVTGIPVISPGVPRTLLTVDHLSYYKIFIPSGTWHFTLVISECEFHVSHNASAWCLNQATLRARALPSLSGGESLSHIAEHSRHSLTVLEPFTDGYYYLLVASDTRVQFRLDVSTTECTVEGVSRSFSLQTSESAISIRHSKNTVRSDWASTIVGRPGGHKAVNASSIDDDDEDPCLPMLRLARIKHAQDFADTFLVQGKEWYTTWVGLSDILPVVLQLEILPFVDIGGTLSIEMHLEDQLLMNDLYQIVQVSACIRKGRAPSRNNRDIVCPEELSFNISSIDESTVDAAKLIPFPEPDVWFVSLQLRCFCNGTITACGSKEVMVSVDIRTQPCMFALDPCGKNGVCQETHKGLYFFTSCACIGGYLGWGCTDDSQATGTAVLLLTTLLLTLSNVFFLPAILLACKRRLHTEALVYLATMIFSTFYHACDQPFYSYCVTKYEVLQFCDFFCSILAFWVTLIALANVPPQVSSALHMVGVLIIAVGVEYNRTGLLVFIIPFSLGVIVPVAAWSFRCCKRRGCIGLHSSLLWLLLPGVLLATVGLLLFAFIETEANYQYVHSAWHIIIALSLVFLLPKHCHMQTKRGNHSDAQLCDINDYYSASPVFILTSDLDTLVPST